MSKRNPRSGDKGRALILHVPDLPAPAFRAEPALETLVSMLAQHGAIKPIPPPPLTGEQREALHEILRGCADPGSLVVQLAAVHERYRVLVALQAAFASAAKLERERTRKPAGGRPGRSRNWPGDVLAGNIYVAMRRAGLDLARGRDDAPAVLERLLAVLVESSPGRRQERSAPHVRHLVVTLFKAIRDDGFVVVRIDPRARFLFAAADAEGEEDALCFFERPEHREECEAFDRAVAESLTPPT